MKNKIRIQLIPSARVNTHGAHCNFDCIWCHNDFLGFEKQSENFSNHDQIEKILDGIRTISEIISEKLPIQISGAGEPTLIGRTSLIELITQLKTMGYSDIGLTTNGSALNKNYIHALSNAGLTSINFSINSLNPQKYAEITGSSSKILQKVLENITYSQLMGIETSVNCIYSSFNENEIDDILDFLKKNQVIWKFFDVLDMPQYYRPIQSLISKLEMKGYSFEKRINQEYVHLITRVGKSFIKIKISREENSCPNYNCSVRDKCTEGCRASIRVSKYGIQPCGIKRSNLVPRAKYGDHWFVKRQLQDGGKYVQV